MWRIPQRGMVKGVCAGIAQHLDVPEAGAPDYRAGDDFWPLFLRPGGLHHSDLRPGPDAGQ
ncbi:hypothetical protein [Acinetobacter baumannii]|uniref:hypothetical protein n=1 Tax=Acinetobacter baumannii TaxID=470 RepID=UPI003C70C99D